MATFNIGDKVRVVADHWIWLRHDVTNILDDDTVLTVIGDIDDSRPSVNVANKTIELKSVNTYPHDFVKVEGRVVIDGNQISMYDENNTLRVRMDAPQSLGVYRPNLEDRKVGKVRVELVDDGFPLALREIAKVMTWAQTAKGYKDHDWQNLPNPEQALSGATSRHRSDNIIQRMVDGLDAKDCVDSESEILHKAHEAFGVLAQLELILRGKIK